MNALKSLAAALSVAALLAWTPAAQAGTSFSFSFHGGDYYTHGHFQDRYGAPHRGYRHGYKFRRHYFAPHRYRGYRPYRPYWRPTHRYRPYQRRWTHVPRCIYRHHNWYCR